MGWGNVGAATSFCAERRVSSGKVCVRCGQCQTSFETCQLLKERRLGVEFDQLSFVDQIECFLPVFGRCIHEDDGSFLVGLVKVMLNSGGGSHHHGGCLGTPSLVLSSLAR